MTEVNAPAVDNMRRLSDQIPAECLCDIFRSLVADGYSDSLLAATHVCRFWRYVALGDATLWRRPSNCNPCLLEEILPRSKNYTLDLVIDQRYSPEGLNPSPPDNPIADPQLGLLWSGAVMVKLGNIRRARSLVIDANADAIIKLAALAEYNGLARPAPHLESLKIVFSEVLGPFNLQLPFLGGIVPKLRHLSLHEYSLHYSNHTFLFSNLRSLELSCRSTHCHRLVKVLQAAPLLEKLVFSSCPQMGVGTVEGFATMAPEESTARLPYLQELVIKDNNLVDTVHILTHLGLDDPFRFRLAVSSDIALTIPQLEDAAEILNNFLTPDIDYPVQCATIYLNRHVAFDSWAHIAEDGYAPEDAPPLHTVRVKLLAPPLSNIGWYYFLALHGVRALILRDLSISVINDLPDMLAKLERVETLDVTADIALRIVPMLATHQRAEQEDWHPCLFPCLEGMKIRPRRDRLGVGEKQKQREVRSLVKMLQEYLRERHDRRWRLEELGAWVEAFPGVDVDATFKGLVNDLILVPADSVEVNV